MSGQPVYPAVPAPAAMVPRMMRVTQVVRELDDTVTLSLDPAPLERFPFEPGQFNMLYLFGAGEVAISMSGNPDEPWKVVHTVRAVGAVTRPLCRARPGDQIGVRGPFGTPWPLEAARGKDVLFIAGGLGLAPLRPAILHVLARRSFYGRVAILYGARAPSAILFRKELEAFRGRFDCQTEATVDHAATDWLGRVGVVTTLVAHVEFDPRNAIAMICGPEIMMRFVARALGERGVPQDSIWLSLERNMKCGIGQCGHCQFGPSFICKDGPVMRFDRIASLLYVREA